MIRISSNIILAALIALPALGLGARVFYSEKEVLEETFPGAQIERVRLHLTRSERDDLVKRTGSREEGRLYTLYLATRNGTPVGMGLFDTRTVRTKNQTLFIAISPTGQVQRISVVSFFEPLEYMVPKRWLKLWNGRDRRQANRPGKDLPGISGATMSTAAVSQTVRKTLFLHHLLPANKVASK